MDAALSAKPDEKVDRPQPGPQMAFLSSPADIAIMGGAAGGGKTWGLLVEPLRHIDNPKFGAVCFRRTTTQVRIEGGLWDESVDLYSHLGAKPREQLLDWKFRSGASVSFAHLEHDKAVFNYHGAQIALLLFDELQQFTAKMFWYLLSRNRSTSGVRPYVRATCNPDADSWLAKFIEWWIDPDTGYPIPERSGVLRWFVRVGDVIVWADTPADLARHTDTETGKPIPPKSVTFIPAKLTDNPALMKEDPGYIANLMALSTVERERLLHGNWKIRPTAGLMFQRSWCEVVDAIPAGTKFVRGWDLGATRKTDQNDPDFTVGVKVGKMPDGRFVIADSIRDQLGPAGVQSLLKTTASRDGVGTEISLPQDPGQAGKAQVQALIANLAGFSVTSSPETGSKVMRFSPFSAQAEAGNVLVLRGSWNEVWFSQLEAFPEGAHDDDADATSRAFNRLTGRPGQFEWYVNGEKIRK
jgi:predicted phage terminase large subunit-like protein